MNKVITQVPRRKQEPFAVGNSKLLVSDEASTDDVLNDASMFVGVAQNLIRNARRSIENLPEEVRNHLDGDIYQLFSADYMLELATASVSAAHEDYFAARKKMAGVQ